MNEYLISSLEQQWKQDPKSRVFFRLAEELRKGGALERAMEVCQAGIQHHPDYVPALVCLGRCRLQLGLRAEAEQIFRQVISRTPDNPHALNGLATICKEAGRFEEALVYFEALAIHEPNNEAVLEEIEALGQARDEANPLDPPTAKAAAEPVFVAPAKPAAAPPVKPATAPPVPPGKAKPATVPPPIPAAAREPAPAVTQSSSEQGMEESAEYLDDLEDLDEPDPIDLEFEKALKEASPVDALLPEFAELDGSVAATQGSGAGNLSEPDERELTKGLKHEHREHLEAAFRIYKNLLKLYPENQAVLGHLARVNSRLKSETKQIKKVRILSNWLDKIKGVYYVP